MRHKFKATLAPALALMFAQGRAAQKGTTNPMNDKAFSHAPAHWLLAGPAADALPLFHEEDRGRYEIGDLLDAERGPSPRSRPGSGEKLDWPSGDRLAWSEVSASPSGRVPLPMTATNEGKGYAAAWLMTYVTVDRFQVFDVELRGTQPRRLWVDGEPAVRGGVSKDGKVQEATGSVKLEQGSHAFMVETIYDPGQNQVWDAGVVLSIAKAPASGLPVVASGTDPARDLRISDILDGPGITGVAISPDGTLVAAALSSVAAGSDDADSWVEVRASRDGSLVRSWRGGVAIGQVSFSPAGRRLTYLARDRREAGKESSTIWLADLDTGETRPLLSRIDNLAGYAWAPDGTSIVYTVTAKPDPDKRGVKLRENLLDRQSSWRERSFLYQVSVPGGATRRLTAGALSTRAADFSPDGTHLLVVREVDDVSGRPYSRKELWQLDLRTLYADKLRDSWWLTDAQYAPDGKRILLLAGPSEFGDLGRNIAAGTTANEADGELYLLDRATGQVDAITRSFDPSISSAIWSRADGAIYVKATDKEDESLYRYDVTEKKFVKLDAGAPVVENVAFADKAPVAACVASGPWQAAALFAVDLHGPRATKLAAPAALDAAKIAPGTVEPLNAASSEGFTIEGRVYLPPGFDPKARATYPAIVSYYGGTLPETRGFGGRYPREWWASRGYVVYVPEPEGAIGYGQKHSAVHVNDWGQVTTGQIIEGTRAFLAAYPAVDPKRVGCIGASYGGYLTMLLLTRTDLFAGAVAHAGISNITSYWGEGNWGYSYSALASADSFPWNRRDLYVDRSPIFSADKVKTPLLLTHGLADTNVPPGESESFYTALKLVGAPVELLTIEGQDHHIVDHAKRALWSRSIVAWFDKWLKKQPAFWDDLYPKTQLK